MSASSAKIIELRQLLSERFGVGGSLEEQAYSTGLTVLDEVGLPRGAMTEIVASPEAGPGGSLLFYGLLHVVLQKGERLILIDGKTGFDPRGLPQAELNRLLWVRCRDALGAMRAADLAVRDGNVPLLVLLLTLNPPNEMRRITAALWQRLHLLAEKSGVTLLAWTPQAQIGCARLRVSVGGAFPLARLHVSRAELVAGLSVQVERRRLGRRDDEELRRPVCA